MKLLFLLIASTVLANPNLRKRYDLDGNGVPDYCYDDDTGIAHCLDSNNKWTTFQGTARPKQTSISGTAKASTPTRPATTSSHITTTSIPSLSTAINAALPTATLPPPSTFASQNNSKWIISRVGYIYSSSMPDLTWDKGRTSVLSGTSFWNFGDVLAKDGLKDGFSMGAAFYSTRTDILKVDTKDIKNVNDWDFAKAHSSDPPPQGNTPFWGMDTSNVAEVSPGVGVGFVWEIWRAVSGEYVDRGAGIIKVTLGSKVPLANRTGPLITGPDGIQVGIMTILNAEGYIYTYSNGGPSGLIIGRSKLGNAFDATKYEFLKTTGKWVPGIPKSNDMSYGVQGNVHSDGQGSIMYSNYFRKYMLFTGAYGYYMNFYTSDTPYGPWSGQYGVAGQVGYGVNVHLEFSPGGSHRVLYISSGAGDGIMMYKLEFKY
ncbi:hypothetical protein IFR05_007970 [Cadophora sp. M221]|nr:hypothetical protein IFR05_007970 [Cadophora sp. M221]